MKRFLKLILILLISVNLYSQTDTEFWFVVPEIAEGHAGDNPSYFRISTFDITANVTISFPANKYDAVTNPTGYADINLTIPANSFQSVNLAAYYNTPAASDDIESFPAGEIRKNGILITSDATITAYFDQTPGTNNPDIWALKGKNAKGTEFYAPFQSLWGNGGYAPKSYSAIDIVATEDNTQITITPTRPVHGPDFLGIGIPFSITLDKGETYSVAPRNYSRSQADYLHGSKITSNKPIVVNIKDDSVNPAPAGCKDVIGDQLIPTNLIGQEYIVMKGNLDPGVNDHIFILATVDGTDVSINGTLMTTIDEGETYEYTLITDATYIYTSEPAYVLHISGFGCELGGAVLPSIENCTGSLEVNFVRASGQAFFLNLMIREGGDSQYEYFFVEYEDGTTFNIPGTWFEPIPSNPDWYVLKKANSQSGSGGPTINVNEVTKVYNTKDNFHLGIRNGGSSSGCNYGYFSDYSPNRGSALAIESQSGFIFTCEDSVQLYAAGGINYSWTPVAYLDDPLSPTPVARPPKGTIIAYDVTIGRRPCFGDTTIRVEVEVFPEVEAFFEVNTSVACAPHDIVITDKSVGADPNQYFWKFGDGNTSTTSPAIRNYTYNNTTNDSLTYNLVLTVQNINSCADSLQRVITVYPEINADFNTDQSIGCHPLDVNFTNTSFGNTDKYIWNFGNDNGTNTTDASNQYENFTNNDTTYISELIAISPFKCTDTITQNITVHPFIKAAFTSDVSKICTPDNVTFNSSTLGPAVNAWWEFDGDYDYNDRNDLGPLQNYVYNSTSAPNKADTIWVTQIVENAANCTDTAKQRLILYPEVVSDITQNTIADICDSTEINFGNSSSGFNLYYNWEFGDGASSDQTAPSHIFYNRIPASNATTTYRTYLTATSPLGQCFGKDSVDITVHHDVKADFAIKYNEVCTPFDVTLENNGYGATDYIWYINNGLEQSTATPDNYVSTFDNNDPSNPRTDQLKLVTISSLPICSDSITKIITIQPEVEAVLSVNDNIDCSPFSPTFNNTNTRGNIASWLWDFGDGISASGAADKTHTYENRTAADKLYDVNLKATDINGCIDDTTIQVTAHPLIEAEFSYTIKNVCDSTVLEFKNSSLNGVNFAWDMGGTAVNRTDKNAFTHTFKHSEVNTEATETYDIQMTASDNNTCSNTSGTQQIEVYPPVVSAFTPNKTEGCNPLTVEYVNYSTGMTSPLWLYGDGESSNGGDGTHIYSHLDETNDKDYTFQLVATQNGTGCKATSEHIITTYSYVKANFSMEALETKSSKDYKAAAEFAGCEPLSIVLTNLSKSNNGNYWQFDNTTTSTLHGNSTSYNPPNQTFDNSSTTQPLINQVYSIFLRAENTHGCADSLTKNVSVYPRTAPDFTMSPDNCHPFTNNFNNTTTDDGATSYVWDFGNGNGSSLVSPQNIEYNNYSYTANKVFDVKLRATTQNGCEDESAVKQVTVYPKPKALYTIDNGADCTPFTSTVNNISEAKSPVFEWNFGDGSALETNQNTSHEYTNSSENIETHTLSLKVTSSDNCVSNYERQITVYPALNVDFGGNFEDCAPHQLQFTNNSNSVAKLFEWDFDDLGNGSNVENPSYNFINISPNDKTFRVHLTGKSEYGCWDTISHLITAYATPVAEFEVYPIVQRYPDATININNKTNVGNWTYNWDMGDGNSEANTGDFEHTYATWAPNAVDNIYTIKLNANSEHCQDSYEYNITLLPAEPQIEILNEDPNGCEPYPVSFSIFSEYGTNYLWDFGDGETDNTAQPSHTFEEAGTYVVKLTLSGDGGSKYDYKTVVVHPKPKVDFNSAPNYVMLPDEPVHFYNLTKDGLSYRWNFGDGNSSTDENPIYQYTEENIFDVKLVSVSQFNCTDSIEKLQLITVDGSGFIEFPNAFVPNPNGASGGQYPDNDISNEIFHPVWFGVKEYTMRVYNRWGELIFETEEINIGWDGYHKGRLCDLGVYVWKAEGIFNNGKAFKKSGDITLIR